jgi:hypothetical protein
MKLGLHIAGLTTIARAAGFDPERIPAIAEN